MRTNALLLHSFLPLAFALVRPCFSQDARIRMDSLCDPAHANRFWSLDEDGTVRQWEVVGTALAGGDTIMTGVPGPALAYCSMFGVNTFITSEDGFIKRYQSGGWVDHAVSGFPMNLGGANNNLYYLTNTNHDLGHFNGTSMVPIAEATGVFTSADVAVHADGSAYVLAGPVSGTTTSVDKYDSGGTLLTSYTLSLNSTHAFGSCMLGDVLYVGFGSTHPNYPNSIVPFTFLGPSVTVGDPIAFPDAGVSYYDLASCAVPTTDAVPDTWPAAQLIVCPNPANELVRVLLPQELRATAVDARLFNALGQTVPVLPERVADELLLRTGGLAPGMHLLRLLVNGDHRYTARVVVEHQ